MSGKGRVEGAIKVRLVRLLVRNDAIRIGRRIRASRLRRWMSLEELARASGLDLKDLRRWEAGDLAGIDSFAVELLGRALQRTRVWLLTGQPEPRDLIARDEAMALDPTVALISRFEDIPSAKTRRRLARYLLFVAVTGQRARVPPHLKGMYGESPGE